MLLYVYLFVLIVKSDCVFMNFCTTQQCQQTANQITHSLNKSASSCSDFYEYSCGGFIKKTIKPNHQPFWNFWQSISEEIHFKLVALINSESEQTESFRKAQQMFKICNRIMEHEENDNIKHLKSLIGEWSLISQQDWGEKVVNVIRNVGVYPVLKIFPDLDFNDTNKRIIYIQHGDVNLPLSVLTKPFFYKKKIELYKKWIYNTIKTLYPNEFKQKNHIVNDIDTMVNFEIKLAKLYSNQDNLNKRISIERLTQITRINWLEILTKLFSQSNYTVNNQQQIVIISYNIFKKLILLLNSTKTNVIDNYIKWSLIKSFSRDTTKHLRNLNFQMDQIFFDIKTDTKPLEECLQHLRNHFAFALIKNYVNFYIQPNTIQIVSEMVHKIKTEFVQLLQKNQWLSMTTKSAAIEKITSISSLIGYPKWIENTTLVELYYQELDIVDNHFLNVLKMRQFQIKKELLKIDASFNIPWTVNPFEVNAFYSVLQNMIVIPVGIIEAPFFDVNRPDVFNYGALGSLIGHELSHALDTTGRKFNNNGQLINWWPQTDIKEYEKRSKCFELQYNNYNIDGFTSLGENIADNVGLKISYNAFKNTKNSLFPTVLPDLGFYTNEQLFFISFAQLWCEIANVNNELLNEGEHAPVKQRVLGTVENSLDFNEAFQCSNTNRNRCTLW